LILGYGKQDSQDKEIYHRETVCETKNKEGSPEMRVELPQKVCFWEEGKRKRVQREG